MHSKMKLRQTMTRMKRHLLITTGRQCFKRLLKAKNLTNRQAQLVATYKRLSVLLNMTYNRKLYALKDAVQWSVEAQVTLQYRAEALMCYVQQAKIKLQDISLDQYVLLQNNKDHLESYCERLIMAYCERNNIPYSEDTTTNDTTNVISITTARTNRTTTTTSNTTSTGYDFTNIMAKNKTNKERVQKEQSKNNRRTLSSYRIKRK